MRDMELLCRNAAEMLSCCTEITVASVNGEGYPRVCVVSPIKSEGYSVVYFSTGTDSEKVRQFRKNPKAGICYCLGGNSQTLTGRVEIIEDPQIKRALWQAWMNRYFSGGPEDPNYCIVKFIGETATLWYGGEFKTFQVAEHLYMPQESCRG